MKSNRSDDYKWLLTIQNNINVLGSKIYVEYTELKCMTTIIQKAWGGEWS